MSSKPFNCPNCDRTLKSLESYEKHMARHDIRNLHVCSICHTDCYTHEAFLAHQKRCHSGEKGEKIQQKLEKNTCHICHSSFMTIAALWSHGTLTHIPFKGFPCPDCGKLISSRSAYLSHRRSHKQKKHLMCRFCEKLFSKKSHLLDHVRIHTRIFQYNCQVCLKGFLKASALNTHLLSKHRPTIDTCSKRTLQRRQYAYRMATQSTSQKSLHPRVKEERV